MRDRAAALVVPAASDRSAGSSAHFSVLRGLAAHEVPSSGRARGRRASSCLHLATKGLEIGGQILLRHFERQVAPLDVLHVLREMVDHLRGVVVVLYE